MSHFSAGHVSKSLSVISMSEDNQALSGAIAQLAEVQKSMEQIHHEQVPLSHGFYSGKCLYLQ